MKKIIVVMAVAFMFAGIGVTESEALTIGKLTIGKKTDNSSSNSIKEAVDAASKLSKGFTTLYKGAETCKTSLMKENKKSVTVIDNVSSVHGHIIEYLVGNMADVFYLFNSAATSYHEGLKSLQKSKQDGDKYFAEGYKKIKIAVEALQLAAFFLADMRAVIVLVYKFLKNIKYKSNNAGALVKVIQKFISTFNNATKAILQKSKTGVTDLINDIKNKIEALETNSKDEELKKQFKESSEYFGVVEAIVGLITRTLSALVSVLQRDIDSLEDIYKECEDSLGKGNGYTQVHGESTQSAR